MTASLAPPRVILMTISLFGIRKENSRTTFCTPGRPELMPVVPGAKEVPAALISRAKISSALRSSCCTASFITASRVARLRAWGP